MTLQLHVKISRDVVNLVQLNQDQISTRDENIKFSMFIAMFIFKKINMYYSQARF